MRMAAFWPTRSPTGEVVKVGFGSNLPVPGSGMRAERSGIGADRTIQESRIADLKTITRSQAVSILEPTPCARPTRLRLHARQDSASRRPTLLTVAAQAAAASAPLTTKWS